MAVTVAVREVHRRSVQASSDRLIYQRAWRVIVTETDTGRGASVDDFLDIMSVVDAEVSLGDQYPGKAAFICNDISVQENEDGEASEVTASYEIPTTEDIPEDFDDFMNRANGPDADNANNPWRPRRSGNGMVVEEYRWRDIVLNPFVNKAKGPLSGIPPIYVNVQVKRVTVIEAGPPDTSQQGKCSGTRLLANVTYEEKDHKNKTTGVITRYYENTYEVWDHPNDSWAYVYIINAGFAYIKDGKLRMIKDPDTGEFVTEPQNLNEDGTDVLAPGTPPNFCEFKIRNEVDLNIPFL